MHICVCGCVGECVFMCVIRVCESWQAKVGAGKYLGLVSARARVRVTTPPLLLQLPLQCSTPITTTHARVQREITHARQEQFFVSRLDIPNHHLNSVDSISDALHVGEEVCHERPVVQGLFLVLVLVIVDVLQSTSILRK